MKESQSVNKFIELISAVAKIPAMYQVSNVDGIYTLILGYIAGSESEILNIFHQDFRTFVNEHFATDFIGQSNHSWPRLLRFYSAGEMHSIELFANLFEQFTISFRHQHGLK